jgi:pyruvate dehydrogenase E2 component (dihydrolipoamide acetyltransferase)
VSDIIMPRLSDSMEEGTIIKWLKQPGEAVRTGEPLADIETDKATVTYEADAEGFLQIVAAEGDTLAIGATIARLLADAESALKDAAAAPAAPLPPSEPSEPATDAVPASEPATDAVPASEPATDAVPASEPAADAVPASAPPESAAAASPPPSSPERIKASPVARRIASERGVDLAALTGSGPEGRIVKADVLAVEAGVAASGAPPAATAGGAKGDVTVLEPTRTQQLIARRMASAKATIPEFQVTVEVDAEAALDLREQLRNAASPLPSVNDLIIKACALALRAHPNVNAAYVDGHFEHYSRVNVGVAVAGAGTLVVPTVFDADSKSLIEIAVQTRLLATQVRDGTVSPADLASGTFTVSNLGMLGVARFTAVINPPQAAILAVGAATPRAVVGSDGAITVRRVMELTISADHRIVYGAEAAEFLAAVRKRLERPAALLL